MTAAQKAAQARFKKAVKIAADIRKKNPKLTQAEAVKKAFATIGAPAKKSAPAKKAAPKKKAAPAKKAAKKSCATDHRDNKSHNVNIRVVSGTKDFSGKLLDELNSLLNKIGKAEEQKEKLIFGIKYKHYDAANLREAKRRLVLYKEYIKSLKKAFETLKKSIK